MENSKLVSEQEQVKRGIGAGKLFGVLSFSILMTVPLLNMLAGMMFFLLLAVRIFTLSAQRAVDMMWLVAGSVVCMFGFFLPALMDGPTSAGMTHGFVLQFVLNALVARFILFGRIWHLLKV